jgi:hypothetical protein
MAQGLSLLIQVTTPEAAHSIAGGFPASNGPKILHYLWLVPMPAPAHSPAGAPHYVLLTTVYDEQFAPYITDLVLANPDFFNNAVKFIVGAENLAPVQSPQNLPKFIDFVLKHDLTRGGTVGNFTQAYPYTVVQIENRFKPPK